MKTGLKQFYSLSFTISLIGVIAFIFDFGFSQSDTLQAFLNGYYFCVLILGIIATILRYFERWGRISRKVIVFDLLSVGVIIGVIYVHFMHSDIHLLHPALYNDNWVKIAVLITFFREFSELNLNYKRTVLNPAQLFIVSFFVIIKLGTWLLMLPNATYHGLSYIDAFFTATSAVCVTGLAVVDTGTYFTGFGQGILLILIQVGGLGILTFASYFSYFFKGGSTYENQLVWSDITSSNKLGDVFSTLKAILIITFSIEMVSAILIYSSVEDIPFSSHTDKVFFAVFHAVSAFCNAGFSTLPHSLAETGFKFNYALHLVIIMTFVFGGLGFPIVSNSIRYLRYSLGKWIFFKRGRRKYRPWILNLNSRITLVTTFSLIVVGFIGFYGLEYSNTLSEHRGLGKVVTALFGATTPRTAGFNTIDTAALRLPTLMLVLFLMWVGASPLSTGGGIKTSTFAIATLNILSLAKGKSRIEIFRREVADLSVRRAFATIALSLIVIGCGILGIAMSDPGKDLLSIAFECFSAYSTVGLSLGITAGLTATSKIILITVMFVGRVSMLTVVIAVFQKVKHKNYRYPAEELTIN